MNFFLEKANILAYRISIPMSYNTQIKRNAKQLDDYFDQLLTAPEIKVKFKSEFTEWTINRAPERLSENLLSCAFFMLCFQYDLISAVNH